MKRREFIHNLAIAPIAAAATIPLIVATKKPAWEPLILTTIQYNDKTVLCPFMLVPRGGTWHYGVAHDLYWIYLSDQPGQSPWYECLFTDPSQTAESWMRILLREQVLVNGRRCELPLATNVHRFPNGPILAQPCDKGYLWTQLPHETHRT